MLVQPEPIQTTATELLISYENILHFVGGNLPISNYFHDQPDSSEHLTVRWTLDEAKFGNVVIVTAVHVKRVVFKFYIHVFYFPLYFSCPTCFVLTSQDISPHRSMTTRTRRVVRLGGATLGATRMNNLGMLWTTLDNQERRSTRSRTDLNRDDIQTISAVD